MTSPTEQKDWNTPFECNNFPTDSTSSSGAGGDFICKSKDQNGQEQQKPAEIIECVSICTALPTSSTSSSSLSVIPMQDFSTQFKEIERKNDEIGGPPNLAYEMNIAKSIMQQYSTLSGDNLYDHLCDIIKRVIDERPPNVIDFFEEFSRNVREQKFHLPERFPPAAIFEETRMYRTAKKQLLSMKLPYDHFDEQIPQAEHLEEGKPEQADELNIDIVEPPKQFFIIFSERIQQLQFYWNQCGFSISTEDIFLFTCSIDRLQTHPSILQCRFWGIINGLRASYYIVEASLTKDQIDKRLEQMEDELREKLQAQLKKERCQPEIPPHIGPELTPGFYGWEKCPPEELEKMTPVADPIPLPRQEETYDIPPEMIGSGLNRFSYFVVNSLSDEWLELPIVTPKQIVVSRQIKKFLTGDLEAEICSYPCFPGKEKHYLRTLIARITCATTIAPRGYYRKMTKMERRLYEGGDDEELEEEEEEAEENEEEEGEGPIDNDLRPIRSEKYQPLPLEEITTPSSWVHVRPHILRQGRIVWFDEEKARRERERELSRLRKLEMAEEGEEFEELEEEEAEGEGEEEYDLEDLQEYGPRIFSPCNNDVSDEFTVPWIARLSSQFTNKQERVLVMRSNVWPGSFSFTFGRVCESIYMGWGHKYVARNIAFNHIPPIVEEYPHTIEDFAETNDPTVADEEAYRLWLLSKEKHPIDDQLDEEDWNRDDANEEVENDDN